MQSQSITLKPERLAELEEYAKVHGQTPADALDDLLAAQLAWEKQDYQEAIEGIRRGYEDVKAGRVQDAEDFLEDLRVEHGFPR
jgi:predicted transcriptional regulator